MDTVSIINKLIDTTKSDTLKWYYLDTHTDLSLKINNYLNGNTVSLLSVFNAKVTPEDNNSFYTKINDGFIVLLSSNNLLHLRIYPTIDSRDSKTINLVNGNEFFYQDELLRLLNLIKKQYPQVEDILSSFMNDNF